MLEEKLYQQRYFRYKPEVLQAYPFMHSDTLVNASQVILRNREILGDGRCLLLAPPIDELAPLLSKEGGGRVSGLTQDFAVYRHLLPLWQHSGGQLKLHYGTNLPAKTCAPFDSVIFFVQKSKPLMRFWFDMLRPLLAPSAILWLVGENKEGIKSWRKGLKDYFADVTVVDNARHCGLLSAQQPEVLTKPFVSDNYLQSFTVNRQRSPLAIYSLPGVFSHGRLDKGTAILFDHIDDIRAEQVLDFGCGTGVISATLAQQLPNAHFTLVDCDALALASARKTMENGATENYQVYASDGLSEVTGQYDLIISNPPFHLGVSTSYEATETFLKQSRNYLVKGGELRIVANSFLKYETIIRQVFGVCHTLSQQKGFSVYSAKK